MRRHVLLACVERKSRRWRDGWGSTLIVDATAIAATLKNRFGYEIQTLHNATQAQVVKAMRQLTEQTERDDSVLIFYAGHGYQSMDLQNGYWLPVDATVTSPDKWLSNKDIARFIDAIPAK